MLRMALTGGIGSGKSMVAAHLKRCGAWVIDSDRLAREAVAPGTPGLRALADEFGTAILAADGTLNRAALAARVFADPSARSRLNAIVHPLVTARSSELIAGAPAEAIVVQEIPLLVETGLAASFPLVMVVHADAAVRLRRLVEQRGMAEADAAARIAAQASDEQRRAAADVWLDNSGERAVTLAAVETLWARRLLPFAANLRQHRPAARPSIPIVVAPDRSWPEQAMRMIARIAAVAGGRARRIDHVGSTAVANLPARDVLDLQVVVATPVDAGRLAEELIDVGLLPRPDNSASTSQDVASRREVVVANADPGRALDCYIRPVHSPGWRDTLLLRDWLRAHPGSVQEFARLKRRLAAQVGDHRPGDHSEGYAAAKAAFLRQALQHARRWATQTGWLVS
jgi:dephospho-CoA kinase